jgi:hypothetical protein
MAKIHSKSRLGDFLVAFHLATRKQVDTTCKSLKPTQLLGQALVQAAICDVSMCEKVATVQRLYQKTAKALAPQGINIVLDEKTFVGDILVALGFVTPEQNNDWLAYQADKRAKGENPGRLGELFVEHNVCTAEQRDLAMQVQNWLRSAN